MRLLAFKKVYLFFISICIFFLHVPFGVAKGKPLLKNIVADSPIPTIVTPNIITNFITKPATSNIYDSLKLGKLGLSEQAYFHALQGLQYLSKKGTITNQKIISIADFSLPSYRKRLFVLDLEKKRVLFNTYVAHGINSGVEFANQFSNQPESNKSSLGFYETSTTYQGKNGYSLHLQGLEKGINDNANRRDIVMHGADYVHENYVNMQGYIGRSQGCPAVPEKFNKPIIDKIKNGTCLFIYSDNKNYKTHSKVLKLARAAFTDSIN
jgi:hypothetical protein